MIEIFYNLTFGGLSVAFFAQALRYLVQISYYKTQNDRKFATYVNLGKVRLLGFAVSSFGGALTVLYLLAEIKGG